MKKSATVEDPGERALYHLACCSEGQEKLENSDLMERPGPRDSSWSELLCAIMEGLERGWVAEAHLTRDEQARRTNLVWSPTKRGNRAINAFRRRNA